MLTSHAATNAWMPGCVKINPQSNVTTRAASDVNPQAAVPVAKPNAVSSVPPAATPNDGAQAGSDHLPPGSLMPTNSTPKMTLSRYLSSSSAVSTTTGTASTRKAWMPRDRFRPLRLSANTSTRRLVTEKIARGAWALTRHRGDAQNVRRSRVASAAVHPGRVGAERPLTQAADVRSTALPDEDAAYPESPRHRTPDGR